ncbi:MAG: LapA family protein [Pseudomonadota bacterium]
MFRYIRYLFLACVAVALIVVSLANRNVVTLTTLPEGMLGIPGAELLTFSIELPLFIVIFGGIAVGLLIGFVWEWLREMKLRSAAARGEREATQLKREVKRLKGEKNEGKDEVLAMLDDA